jgi:hypothetical protein
VRVCSCALTADALLPPLLPSARSALLPIVMAGESKRTRHLERFTEYLQTRSDLKFISADLWLGFLNFSLQIDADLSNFDTNGAWPLVLDDFVAASKVKTH